MTSINNGKNARKQRDENKKKIFIDKNNDNGEQKNIQLKKNRDVSIKLQTKALKNWEITEQRGALVRLEC